MRLDEFVYRVVAWQKELSSRFLWLAEFVDVFLFFSCCNVVVLCFVQLFLGFCWFFCQCGVLQKV